MWRDADDSHQLALQTKRLTDHIRVGPEASLPAAETNRGDRRHTVDVARRHDSTQRRTHAERVEIATADPIDLQSLTGVLDDRCQFEALETRECLESVLRPVE